MSIGTQGPATNLLQSLVQFGGTLLVVAQTRVELLTTEISEDVERGIRVLLLALVAVLAATLGVLLAGFTLVIYFWDTHRMAAATSVTVAFLLAAVVAGFVCCRRMRQKPRLLDATRTELRRDLMSLRSDP
jgi:uncharacterized membrane protein YqjE